MKEKNGMGLFNHSILRTPMNTLSFSLKRFWAYLTGVTVLAMVSWCIVWCSCANQCFGVLVSSFIVVSKIFHVCKVDLSVIVLYLVIK